VFLAETGMEPLSAPEMKSYLWEEADILDPAGNRIRIFKAGAARRFPPWRIDAPSHVRAPTPPEQS